MKYLVASMMLFCSMNAWACSCLNISSIEETIATYPVLVEAQVLSLEQTISMEYGTLVHSAKLKVLRTLKSPIAIQVITVEASPCSSSLDINLMKLGHTYILPLSMPIKGWKFEMAGCAHSGMELVSGKLYTFEQDKWPNRRLQFYKNYSDFLSELKKNC